MRYFDTNHNRLIYIEKQATSSFWDEHWQSQKNLSSTKIRKTQSTFVSQITKRYMKPSDGLLLEGGCGNGQHVAALVNNGYQCIGVDFAQQTIESTQIDMPDLDVRLGDVHSLNFDDNSFAGYWSLGLIEHFWDGYTSIVCEMSRVLKSGGYLFVTCPYMSPLRIYKSRHNYYPIWTSAVEPDDFYQFALNSNGVVREITSQDFKLCHTIPLSGLKGFKGEMPSSINKLLNKLYDYRGKSIIIRGIRFVLEKMLTPFAAHSALFIFQRL